MLTAKTYTVGSQGRIRRLDNLSGAWTDVSLTFLFPQTVKYQLYDVETDPLDGNKVFAVGEGNLGDSVFGIYVSPDGGITWFIPGGNYQTNIDGTGKQVWNEIWVLDSSNIMVAGNNGYVAISNDGGVTFTLTSQLPSLPTCIGCSSAIPTVWSLHFISPTVGVVGLDAHVALTINGGASWTILNGGNVITGLPNGDLFRGMGIHLSSNQQTIVVVNFKSIFRSTDGGNTWSVVYSYSNRNGRHLTWINDQELWAFAIDGERLKSTDAGATWTVLSGWSPTGPAQYAGHFYLNQNGFFSQDQDILSTNNGATSGVLSETAPYVIAAVWTWFQDITCYLLTACDGVTAPILVDNDLSLGIGQIIKVCPSDLPPAGGAGSGSGTSIPANPNDPGNTAFSLVDCCGVQPTVVVTNNLAPYISGIVVIPSISFTTCWHIVKGVSGTNLGLVDITGGTFYTQCSTCNVDYPCQPLPVLAECKCFTISVAAGCDGSITLNNIGPIYSRCATCAAKCFLLIDCLDPNNFLVVSNDFSLYLNQVIHLQECPDTCWHVFDSSNCNNSVCVSDVIAVFDTCVDCLPAPVIPPPVELQQRRVKPGYNTPGCPPEYTEQVSCSFGEQVYNQMLVERYGLTICCEEDRIKWDIKKQILDLKALYNSGLCNCTINACCPPKCVDAFLTIFNPMRCPAPENADAILTMGDPCIPPELNFVWLHLTT